MWEVDDGVMWVNLAIALTAIQSDEVHASKHINVGYTITHVL